MTANRTGGNSSSVKYATVEATEPDQLSVAVGRVTTTVPRIERLRPGRFSARVEMCSLSSLVMMILSANNLKAHADDRTGYTTANLPLSGEITTDQGTFRASVVPDSGDITVSSVPLRLKSAASTTMVLRFNDSLLREAAARLTGCRHSTDLNFDGVLDLRSRPGRMFVHNTHLAWSAIRSNELDEANKKRTVELELACDFLLTANVAGETALDEHDNKFNAVAIQRAEDWILDQLAEPISRADLCEISGLHVRTLTRGFQLLHGVGPMQFLREQRLDAIRQVLLCSRPEETSVTRIAEDFGMWHLGRFAHAYRLRFHERPTESLNR